VYDNMPPKRTHSIRILCLEKLTPADGSINFNFDEKSNILSILDIPETNKVIDINLTK
jgi:hypothetical protein